MRHRSLDCHPPAYSFSLAETQFSSAGSATFWGLCGRQCCVDDWQMRPAELTQPRALLEYRMQKGEAN